MEFLDDYCAITEYKKDQFHKTRVAIWSFIQNNQWFDGKIIILSLSGYDLKPEDQAHLYQIYDNIELIKVDKNYHDIVKQKINKKSTDVDHSLDYAGLYALKIKSKGNLYFSSSIIFNRDVTSFLSIESAVFARKSGRLPSGSGDELNSSMFYIPGEHCSDRLFNISLKALKNHNNIFSSSSRAEIITSALSGSNVSTQILDLINLVDSSSFPDSKYRDFLRHSKAICAINMNTIDLSDPRFIRINLYWQQINKQSLSYKPSKTIVTKKRLPGDAQMKHLEVGRIRSTKRVLNDYHSKFCVMITTCQRPVGIKMLTEQIKSIDSTCRIVVVDDATDSKIETRYIDDYIRLDKNNGKEKWWKTVNLLWSKALEKNHMYYIMLPDDCLPKPDVFIEAERLWKSIDDPNKVAMHLANNNRMKNWTHFVRRDYSNEIFLTQTTEFSFICDGQFIRYIIPSIPKSEWARNPLKSSGVGPRLNRFWVKSGMNIYGVKSSLIYQNELCTESVMNPIERKLNPWILK